MASGSRPGSSARALLLDAAAALGAGLPVDAVTLYREARALCQVEALAEQEVAALMQMAKGAPEPGVGEVSTASSQRRSPRALR